MSEDFPEPFTPTSPTRSPSSMVKVSPSKTARLPKERRRPAAWRSVMRRAIYRLEAPYVEGLHERGDARDRAPRALAAPTRAGRGALRHSGGDGFPACGARADRSGARRGGDRAGRARARGAAGAARSARGVPRRDPGRADGARTGGDPGRPGRLRLVGGGRGRGGRPQHLAHRRPRRGRREARARQRRRAAGARAPREGRRRGSARAAAQGRGGADDRRGECGGGQAPALPLDVGRGFIPRRAPAPSATAVGRGFIPRRAPAPSATAVGRGFIPRRAPAGYTPSFLKKSFPLSSTRMNAGKFSTSIFHTASIPSSGKSMHSTFLMFSSARMAAGPPMEPR